MVTSSSVLAVLTSLRERVDAAAVRSGRRPGEVRILLATKTQPAETIIEALQAGFTLIGENRVQEVLDKAAALEPYKPESHFIGHLQKNKINQVLRYVSCIESVDSLELARKLSRDDRVLDVMMQVNVSGETSKFGFDPESAAAAAREIAELPGLKLRGYMTIGLNSPDLGAVKAGYLQLARLRDEVALPEARELSMGMSGDFEIAIEAGATIVRLGSAVFGARQQVP